MQAAVEDTKVDPEQQAQIIEIIQFLLSNKKEARHQALDIILAYSSTTENRRLFKETDCCKELLRLLPEADEEAQLKIIKALINFSQDVFFIV